LIAKVSYIVFLLNKFNFLSQNGLTYKTNTDSSVSRIGRVGPKIRELQDLLRKAQNKPPLPWSFKSLKKTSEKTKIKYICYIFVHVICAIENLAIFKHIPILTMVILLFLCVGGYIINMNLPVMPCQCHKLLYCLLWSFKFLNDNYSRKGTSQPNQSLGKCINVVTIFVIITWPNITLLIKHHLPKPARATLPQSCRGPPYLGPKPILLLQLKHNKNFREKAFLGLQNVTCANKNMWDALKRGIFVHDFSVMKKWHFFSNVSPALPVLPT